MKKLEQLPEWVNLKKHHQMVSKTHLRDLFTNNPKRFEQLSVSAAGLLLDYSKNRIIPETIEKLCQLARACDLPEKISALFNGSPLNSTENQAALHMALRDFSQEPLYLDKSDIGQEVHQCFEKMTAFAEKIRQKTWLGCTGLPITDVVNIGIGGSDLGPKMACEALGAFKTNDVNLHFISNADTQNISRVLSRLQPATTLFIISSKSFCTKETLLNAKTAKQWFTDTFPAPHHAKNHFLAVTHAPHLAIEFGIPVEHIFKLWQWVGGRYSVWSAIGLPILFLIGTAHFKAFLAGAHAMDQHFLHANLEQNMPVILGLLGIWHVNFFGSKTHAILPYCEALKHLPAYLQQAEMESNGKSVTHGGKSIRYHTSPVIWGEIGTNGQHAFHQLLHQGTQLVPADFILPFSTASMLPEHQNLLVSSCLSQSQALMLGKTADEVYAELLSLGYSKKRARQLAPHKVLPGNRSSNTIVLQALTPYSLGALLALYEHKIFVQSVIWNINCFDQWGVELGKQLADHILCEFNQEASSRTFDSSTEGLMKLYTSI